MVTRHINSSDIRGSESSLPDQKDIRKIIIMFTHYVRFWEVKTFRQPACMIIYWVPQINQWMLMYVWLNHKMFHSQLYKKQHLALSSLNLDSYSIKYILRACHNISWKFSPIFLYLRNNWIDLFVKHIIEFSNKIKGWFLPEFIWYLSTFRKKERDRQKNQGKSKLKY